MKMKKNIYYDAKTKFLRRTTQQNIKFILELNKDKIFLVWMYCLEEFDPPFSKIF